MKRLSVNLPDETMGELDHIAEASGKNKTDVIIGMIQHWAAVMADHEARGFHVVPLPAASFSAAMVADRASAFDELAPGRPTPDMAMGAPAAATS